MNKIAVLLLLTIGVTGVLLANPGPPAAPEIDPGSITSALALLSCGLLMRKGQRKVK